MEQISFDNFYKHLINCAQYGLDEESANALIEKGRDYCDYYDKTVLSCWYETYKSTGVPFWLFAATLYMQGNLNEEGYKKILDAYPESKKYLKH